MKPDHRLPMPDDRAVAEMASSRTDSAAAPTGRLVLRWILHAAGLVLATLGYFALALLLSLLLVRVGADLIQGIDPFSGEVERPRLYPRQIAQRAIAVDLLRQVILAALVIGFAARRDPRGWRRTLALQGEPCAGLPRSRLIAILVIWPALHILWVTGTAELFRTPFGHNVRLSPVLTPAAAAVWIASVGLLAPCAEELLMRGEMFSRARRFLRAPGAILFTAGLFALMHLSQDGVARPVSLLPLALVLGWLRWRTGRLWPCIVLHGWSNLAMVAYVLWPEAG